MILSCCWCWCWNFLCNSWHQASYLTNLDLLATLLDIVVVGCWCWKKIVGLLLVVVVWCCVVLCGGYGVNGRLMSLIVDQMVMLLSQICRFADDGVVVDGWQNGVVPIERFEKEKCHYSQLLAVNYYLYGWWSCLFNI